MQPERTSPMPPHLFLLPGTQTKAAYSEFLGIMTSFLPLMTKVTPRSFLKELKEPTYSTRLFSFSLLSIFSFNCESSFSSKFKILFRCLNSVTLGVRTHSSFLRWSMSWGAPQRKNSPSASITIRVPSGSLLMNLLKKIFMCFFLPRPGPTTQLLILEYKGVIFDSHPSATYDSYYSVSFYSCSSLQSNTGCTISSGEYDLMASAA